MKERNPLNEQEEIQISQGYETILSEMPVSFAPMPCLMPTYTYYTVVAVKFGRGSLIQTGMNLDEERGTKYC
jgi:hypothetical protein